jgi:hypothetical protein
MCVLEEGRAAAVAAAGVVTGGRERGGRGEVCRSLGAVFCGSRSMYPKIVCAEQCRDKNSLSLQIHLTDIGCCLKEETIVFSATLSV